MGTVILGTAGFLLYFIYDINSIIWKNFVLQRFFALGSICVAASAVWAVWDALRNGIRYPVICVGFGAISLAFLVMLVYTLFFALPFDETYREENRVRMAYTEGVYSLCRHPGVLWFAGAYLCLWGMTGELCRGIYFITMICWNCLYILMQDLWIFPRTFINYRDYKQNTPFLVPNKQSIKAYFSYCRK